MLSRSESYFVSVVLEDCLDRLNIMGEVMENRISKHMSKRTACEDSSSSSSSENDSDNNATPENIFYGKKKQLLSAEEKLNEDRKRLEEVLSKTLHELQCTRTYQALSYAINEDKMNKLLVLDLKKRIHDEQQQLENLKEEITEVQKEVEAVQNEMEMVVYKMRDQLQKSKARLDLEVKYIFKKTEVSNVQAHKFWSDQEQELKIKIQYLRSKISYEDRINIEIIKFMDQDQKEYEEKLNFWQQKFIADVENKDEELEVLKKNKALNLKKIQELSRRLEIYETVVENDRIEKQIEKEKKEQEEREYNCIVKVQAWWRGMMVRKKLGPFAEQEKKTKKGKGGKKGKGKGKK